MGIRPLVLSVCLSALGPFVGAAAAAAHAASPPCLQRSLRLFYGGTFHTNGPLVRGEEDEPAERLSVEAVLVRDTRIVALGNYAEISGSEEAQGAERIDLGGAHVYPGFQDAHGYLERLGATLEDVDLAGAQSFAEVIERARDFASTVPAGEWVVGTGWDESLWETPAYPSHEALSEAVPDHPVLLRRLDGQVGVANLVAMGQAGLDPADPEITGLFTGDALERIAGMVPAPSRKTRRRRILRAQSELLPLGLTAVHAMDVDAEALELFIELRDRGELKLRLVCYLDSMETARSLGEEGIAAVRDRYGVVAVAGVGWEIDGGLGSRGAALLEPYADVGAAEGSRRGTAKFTPQALGNSIEACARLGLQPAIRATGDCAVRIAVQAIRQASQRADGFELAAPRIEYLQLIAEQDLGVLDELWVQPTMMPQHLATDLRWIPQRLGAARAARAYGWRTVRERASRPLAFGSAFPIGAPAPLLGVHAAITRQDVTGKPVSGFYPSERLSAVAAVSGYTSGAAAAAREDDERGRIALGYAADFTALSEDLFRWNVENATEALGRTTVVATIVNGDVVFSSRR